ncbi:MAG TPA: hypothetical protein VF240_15620 [Pyrinomonadaceae bacterium]
MKVKFSRAIVAVALAVAASSAVLADTIRLKNGSIIRGQVVGFRDEQFTVLMEPTARGRRNRIQVYIEEVESIEFDGAPAGSTTADAGDTQTAAPVDNRASNPAPSRNTSQPSEQPRMQGAGNPPPANNSRTSDTGAAQPSPSSSSPSSQFFPVRVRVRADNAANGWTDSGLMVRKGQRLRISASGRISLGQGRFATPTGLSRVADNEKLMRDEPTGALIAVVGDDNDEFVYIGAGREFYATRDGRLFLGINEGNLADNTGTYDALIEAEPVTSGQARP